MKVSQGMVVKKAITIKEVDTDTGKKDTESIYITYSGKMYFIKDYDTNAIRRYNEDINSGTEYSAIGKKWIYSFSEQEDDWIKENYLKTNNEIKYEFSLVPKKDRAKYLKYFI